MIKLQLSDVMADIISLTKTSATEEESQGVSVHAGASTCVCVRGCTRHGS